MADSNTLKEFLVSLGFRVDETSHSAFTNTIIKSTAEITAFATAVEGAAALVVAKVGDIAGQLEELYFASQRLGASAENIRTFGFAASRLGSSVGAARAALEQFRTTIGQSPGMQGLLRSMGIDPSQDTTKVLTQFGQYLRSLPEWLARVRAAQFGIDWRTAIALMDEDFQKLQVQSDAMAKRLGINMQQATKDAHTFQTQLALLGQMFDLLRIRVEQTLAQRLSSDIQKFRELFEANFNRIVMLIDLVAKGILWAADALLRAVGIVTEVFGTLYNLYSKLNPQTQEFLKTLTLVVLGFLFFEQILKHPIASLIGAVGLAIAGLTTDYEAWKRGDPHIIHWEIWGPELQKASDAIGDLWSKLKGVASVNLASDTFTNFVSTFANLSGTIAQNARAFWDGLTGKGGEGPNLSDAATQAFKAATQALTDLNNVLSSPVVQDAMKTFGGILRSTLITGLNETYDILKLISDFLQGKWGAAWADAKKAVSDNVDGMIDAYKRLKEFFVPRLPGLSSDPRVNPYAQGTPEEHAEALRARPPMNLGVSDWFYRMLDKLDNIANVIKESIIPGAHADELVAAGLGLGPITQDNLQGYLRGSGGGGTGGPGGLPTRTNNPLALTVAPGLVGRVPAEGRFRKFGSLTEGYMAAIEQLQSYGKQGLWTVRQIISRWAPREDNNNTDAYISAVAARMGMSSDAILDLYDSDTMYKLLTAMAQQEDSPGFRQNERGERNAAWQAIGNEHYYQRSLTPPEMGQSTPTLANSSGRVGGASMLRVESTINVHGVADPQAVADRVMQEYDRHNLDALRNAQSAVR